MSVGISPVSLTFEFQYLIKLIFLNTDTLVMDSLADINIDH